MDRDENCSVPVVDYSQLHENSEVRALAIKVIGNACKDLGCFQIINHGINTTIMNDALGAASDFFDLSAEEKEEFASDDISKPVRYKANPKDGISRARDLLKLYAHPLSDWIHLWPSVPQDYREKMGNYVMEARKVALQVIAAILESLGLDQAYLRDKFDCGMQVIATNFYPRCFETNLEVGLNSHSDYGFITILLQNCEGLQVKNPKEEKWRAVPHIEDALYAHIGDYMEVLSNGQYKSLVHRALLNPEKKRISIASIHNLSMDEKVAPANDLVDELNPMRYKDTSFRDFLNYLSTEDCKKSKRYIEHFNILGE